MVGSGAIGVPKHVTILLHIPLLADPAAEVPPWWTRPASGGGWLGAHVPHVIDQVRVMLGEITAVSALLPRIVDRPWDVEDAYSVQFRLASGATGLIQSTAADWGPFLLTSRVLGTEGTIWAEGDTVRVATGAGTRTVEMPADLAVAPPSPPPADQLHTAYDMLHSTGLDMGPWIRMAETFRALIEHRPVPADPPPATFHDGVASMEVLDAIRRSAASGAWASVS
jgi:predicted dehydrogenase